MTLTTAELNGRAHNRPMDDHDPAPKPKRRTFTKAEKQTHLNSYDALPKGEERGAYLRREGLYASHISEWRKQAARAKTARPRNKPKTSKRSPDQIELDRLRRRNTRLETEFERTKAALEITGKVHALLESISESADTEPRSTK